MKKTYQIQRDIEVAANQSKVFNFQLKDNYARCTGFFISQSGAGSDLSYITISLNIAQTEILPTGTDAYLFNLTSYISREDATYKFAEDNIPARSSDVQLTVNNTGNSTQKFNAYFILEN